MGTPGVDLGNAQALDAVARSTAIISNKFRQNEQLTNKVDAIQRAQDITTAANSKIVGQQNLANRDNRIDGGVSMKVQQLIFDKEVKDGLAGIENRRVRRLAKLQLASDRGSAFNGIAKWGVNRQAIDHLAKGNAAINSLTAEAREGVPFNGQGGLIEKLQKADGISRLVASGVSAKEGAKFITNTPKSIVKGYFDDLIRNDPQRGLDELNKNGAPKNLFGQVLDTKELKEIETNLIKARDGLDKRNNYASQARLASTFADTVADPSLLQSVKWLNDTKNELEEDGKMTPQIKSDLNRQIDSVLKKNQLNAKRDPQTLIDLTVEFNRIGTDDDGNLTNDEDNFSEAFNFMMRLSQAWNDGKIGTSDYKTMAAGMRKSVEDSITANNPDEPSGGGAFEGVKRFFGFGNTPYKDSLRQMDNFLSSAPDLTDEKELQIQASMRTDLNAKIELEGGIDNIDNKKLQELVTEINKETWSKFGVTGIPEGGVVQTNDVTGEQRILMPDGTVLKLTK